MALALNSEGYSNCLIENMAALLYSNSSQLMSRRGVHRKGQAVGGGALSSCSHKWSLTKCLLCSLFSVSHCQWPPHHKATLCVASQRLGLWPAGASFLFQS